MHTSDMVESETISVRIPKDVKRRLENLKIDYAKEIKRLIIELIMEKNRNAALDALTKHASRLKKPVTNFAAKFIIEDRNNGH